MAVTLTPTLHQITSSLAAGISKSLERASSFEDSSSFLRENIEAGIAYLKRLGAEDQLTSLGANRFLTEAPTETTDVSTHLPVDLKMAGILIQALDRGQPFVEAASALGAGRMSDEHVLASALYLSGAVEFESHYLEASQKAWKGLCRDIYEVLSLFHPTQSNDFAKRYEYCGLALIDGRPLFAEVNFSTMSLDIETSEASFSFDLEEAPAARAIKERGPGTPQFLAAEKMFSALRDRLTSDSEKLSQSLLERVYQAKPVRIMAKELDPEGFTETILRLERLETANAALLPIHKVDYAHFVKVVARFVKILFPEKEAVTGNESTWVELKSHEGLSGSYFAEYYHPRVHGDRLVIDLAERALWASSGEHRPGHFFDPIRNEFLVRAEKGESGDGFRFFIQPSNNRVGNSLLPFLDLYQVMVSEGLPVVIDKRVVSEARGETVIDVMLDDPRLLEGRISLRNKISRPLEEGEISPLPPWVMV